MQRNAEALLENNNGLQCNRSFTAMYRWKSARVGWWWGWINQIYGAIHIWFTRWARKYLLLQRLEPKHWNGNSMNIDPILATFGKCSTFGSFCPRRKITLPWKFPCNTSDDQSFWISLSIHLFIYRIGRKWNIILLMLNVVRSDILIDLVCEQDIAVDQSMMKILFSLFSKVFLSLWCSSALVDLTCDIKCQLTFERRKLSNIWETWQPFSQERKRESLCPRILSDQFHSRDVCRFIS